MSKVTWATQFMKQDVLRTLTIGFQPYMPFSQQYAMSLRPKGEPGYFELSPEPLVGPGNSSATGRGRAYSFAERMKTYMGEGQGRLAKMSQYYEEDRATQVANSPPQGMTNALKRAQELSGVWSSILESNDLQTRDLGELTLGEFTQAMDNTMRTSSEFVNRGIQRGGKFWGNDFDIKLEQTTPEFREFLEKTIGVREMRDVKSLEMTRASGSSSASKILSMSKKELSAEKMKGKTDNAKFKSHVTSQLATMNDRIKSAVKAMVEAGGNETFDHYSKSLGKGPYGVTGKQNQLLSTRALITAGSDDIIDRTIRDFIGKTTRSSMIQGIDAATGPAQHLYQVRLGNDKLGFALLSAKAKMYKKQPYPHLQAAPKVIVLETNAGANQLVNAFGDWLKTRVGADSVHIDAQLVKAENHASSQAVLTQDRVALVGHTAAVDAAEMVGSAIGLGVGDKVLSNVTLVPMDIAENIRRQMIDHFTKGGASKKFQQWYRKLMEDSNELTKAWFNNVPKSTRKGGKTFSEEWVFGDNKGNPNKRFLGVWSEQSQDTWKNDVGRNVSISPFIISRRKGVAAFRKGGDFDQ
tara:strand:- start:366 stop:2105 length:1740 start_codon:yes stop_codon:yes gene_type:complete